MSIRILIIFSSFFINFLLFLKIERSLALTLRCFSLKKESSNEESVEFEKLSNLYFKYFVIHSYLIAYDFKNLI
ncbi:hypothetical protein BpHYR1_045188, partial [Brachionus plicatilis]